MTAIVAAFAAWLAALGELAPGTSTQPPALAVAERTTAHQLCDACSACTTVNPIYRRLLKLALEELRLIEDHTSDDVAIAQIAVYRDVCRRRTFLGAAPSL
jgi:hypothetical protein